MLVPKRQERNEVFEKKRMKVTHRFESPFTVYAVAPILSIRKTCQLCG